MNKPATSFRVSALGDEVLITGTTRQRVSVSATAFFRALSALPSPRAIDLLMIAVGAYAVDRMVPRHGRRTGNAGIRSFSLTFGVQDLSFWSRQEIKEQVAELLTFLTDDNWSVSFERSAENLHQVVLPIKGFAPTRIALFSEGLDSAAGLANEALSAEGEKILLVTVSHYAPLRHRTERQVSRLIELVPGLVARTASLPVSLRGNVARRLQRQETSQRSRAFLFCAAAIAAAATCEVNDMDVFENGAGAINLPPMTGMLIGGLATRGAHPSFLRKASALGSLVLDRTVAFVLPNLGITKGELVARLRGSGLDSWLQQSRSCIHTSIRIAGISHCGLCPGCIERRLAMHLGGIEEDASKYSVDVFKTSSRSSKYDYLDTLLESSKGLLSDDPQARRRLRAHLRGTEMDPADDEMIRELLCRNAKEVQRVFSSVEARLAPHPTAPGANSPSAARIGVAS